MTEEKPDPRDLINSLVANAADLPGCESCCAETNLIETSQGTFVHAISHDDGCEWLRQRKQGDGQYADKKFYAMEDIARVAHERNQ